MGRLLSWNSISKNKNKQQSTSKIGNDSSYAEEPEITVNVNGAKQIQITPKYSFNVFKEDNEEDSDFQYESLNEDIATVGENGLVTGVKVGTTWIKVKEVATGKENIVIVRVIESDSNMLQNSRRRWICSSIKSRWKYMGIWI